MSVYESSVPQFAKMLKSLDKWVEKTVAHAQAKSFDPNVLLTSRLAPDQYPLVKQIQAACDSAKQAASLLAGKEPPKHPDTEQTIDEIRARIRTVLALLETFKPADYDGADGRRITLSFLPPNKYVRGSDYLTQLALPNFYFHITTAYAILRHNGVDLGKRDYVGGLPLQDA